MGIKCMPDTISLAPSQCTEAPTFFLLMSLKVEGLHCLVFISLDSSHSAPPTTPKRKIQTQGSCFGNTKEGRDSAPGLRSGETRTQIQDRQVSPRTGPQGLSVRACGFNYLTRIYVLCWFLKFLSWVMGSGPVLAVLLFLSLREPPLAIVISCLSFHHSISPQQEAMGRAHVHLSLTVLSPYCSMLSAPIPSSLVWGHLSGLVS